MTLGELTLDLLERPAQPRERVLGNADAGIRDGNADPPVRCACADRDATAFRGELHRIGKQVQHNLLEQAMVGHQADAVAHPGGELELLVVRAPRYHAHRVVEEWLELDLLRIEPDSAGLDLGHVEDVVDHVEQVLAALVDVRAIFAILVRAQGTEHAGRHDFGEPDNSIERRA